MAGALLLAAFGPLHAGLSYTAKYPKPPAAEVAVLAAEAVALYATGQAIALIKEANAKPCDKIEMSLNPLDILAEQSHKKVVRTPVPKKVVK